MIHWKIVNKIQEDLLREYPDLSQEENLLVALRVYHEYERILLTGEGQPTSPAGITTYSYAGTWTLKTE